MTNSWKRLALLFLAALLCGLLAGCGESGGSQPPAPPQPGTATDYVVDEARGTITAKDGSWKVVAGQDEEGERTVYRLNLASLDQLERCSYVVALEAVVQDQTEGTAGVLCTLAIPRSALESENELVNALTELVLEDDEGDVVAANLFYVYDMDGEVQTLFVVYDGYSVTYTGSGGGLTLETSDPNLDPIFRVLVGAAAEEEQIVAFLEQLGRNAWAARQELLALAEAELGSVPAAPDRAERFVGLDLGQDAVALDLEQDLLAAGASRETLARVLESVGLRIVAPSEAE